MIMPRTRRPLVSLTVSSPSREDDVASDDTVVTFPWFAAAVLGALAAVALGWLAVAVVASAAWLTATRTPLTSLLDVIGQGWLAAHGARVQLGDVHLSLIPLGLSALAVAGVAVATHWAGLQLAGQSPRWRDLGVLVATSAGSYAIGALVLASLVGTASQATSAFGGAALVGLTGALVGGVRGLGLDPFAALPGWVRQVPHAMGMGVLWLAGGSLLALGVGLVQRWDQAQALHRGLAPDALGTVLLVVLYLAYLPTMLAWAGSYALGAGLSLGTGTLVTPGSSVLGLLPAFPPLAAVPPAGMVYDWAWLTVGVAAGAAAGAWFCRREAAAGGRPRWTRWSWQAALGGLFAALAWLAVSWLSRGDLGSGRLVGLGPLFPSLLWFTLVPLVVGSAASGTVGALVLARRTPPPPPEEAADQPAGEAAGLVAAGVATPGE